MTDLTGPHPVHLFKFVSICLLLSAIMNLTKVSDFKSIAGRSNNARHKFCPRGWKQ